MKLNNSGLSLVNVLIMVAVISITIPVILGQLTDSNKRQAQRANYQKYVSFVTGLKEKLQDPQTCTDILRGVTVNRTLGATRDITINTGYGDSPGPIAPGWKYSDESFSIERVYIQASGNHFNNVRPWGSGGALQTVPFRIFVIPQDVKIDVTRLNPDFRIRLRDAATNTMVNLDHIPPETQNPLLMQELQITILANLSGNQIQTCFGPETRAATCESVGGVYTVKIPGDSDPYGHDPNLKCRPDKRCFGSSIGIVEDPGSCPSPYNNSIQNLGVVNGRRKYLCGWCHVP